jgi:hypothetical protein
LKIGISKLPKVIPIVNENIGYVLCEIAFGIWGSGSTSWSRMLHVKKDRLAWKIASPLYNIGNWFYSRGIN